MRLLRSHLISLEVISSLHALSITRRLKSHKRGRLRCRKQPLFAAALFITIAVALTVLCLVLGVSRGCPHPKTAHHSVLNHRFQLMLRSESIEALL